MYETTIAELRRTVEAGAPLTQRDAMTVLDALTRAQRAAAVPSEFVVRVARAENDIERWEATHPLLRGTRHVVHPADALALASIDLRASLARHDWPERRRRSVAEVPLAVAEALAANDDGETADALRWVLAELDRRTAELHDLRHERWLRSSADTGDAAARDELRAQAAERLRVAGVQSNDRTWSVDGFGEADEVGLTLPCLVVAMPMRERSSIESWRFHAGRSWHALEHCVAPRPMSRYERAIVSPLLVSDATELALRRMAPRVPDGRTVRDVVAFHALATVELPGVDIGGITDQLSPAWVPLPTSAIAALCNDTPDEHIDLDSLVTHEGVGPWAAWWKVAWVTDVLGEGSW